jgi:hypothetical protein
MNDLQLNSDKSEVVVFGTAKQLQSAAAVNQIDIAGCSLPVSTELKSLGVICDSHFRFDSHVSAVTKACIYHTRALRHIRNVLSDNTAKTIACSIVAARLDYCNSLLYGAPVASINKLQCVQNTLARVVSKSCTLASATPLLKSLHWLPVKERINYKIAILAFQSFKLRSTPVYLQTLLRPHTSTRSLRSTDAPQLVVQRTRTEIGKRAFAVAAPTVWNALSNATRCCDSIISFKRRLKTDLFEQAFAS